MATEEQQARQLLEKIRRLPHNKKCVNCDKEAMLGHGDVCVKFRTFVCHTCKSAHQAYSHRCKSVTLSNWTLAEAQQLTDANGGGNANARQTWLGQLNGKLMLGPSDSLDRVKNFVLDAYEYKRYYMEPRAGVRPPTPPGTAAAEEPQRSSAIAPQRRSVDRTQGSVSNGLAPPRASSAVGGAARAQDMFSFDAPSSQQPSQSSSTTAAVNGVAADPFFTSDPFANDNSKSSDATGSGFDFMAAPTATAQQPATSSSSAPPTSTFDPFPAQQSYAPDNSKGNVYINGTSSASASTAWDPFAAAPPLSAQPATAPGGGGSGFDFMNGPAPAQPVRAEPVFDPLKGPPGPNHSAMPPHPGFGGLNGPISGARPAMAFKPTPLSDPFACISGPPAPPRGPPMMGFAPPPRPGVGMGMGMMAGAPPPMMGPGFNGPRPPYGHPPAMGMPMGGPRPHPPPPPQPQLRGLMFSAQSEKEHDPFEGLAWGK